ncbi:Imm50 family immunity protein, partial [Luteimonas sp. A501]
VRPSMTTTVDRIRNAAAITSVFGGWPSFHDAEVLRLELSRHSETPFGPALLAEIHVFSMTSQVDARGHFVCENHSVVALRFDGVADLELDGFNHQNALSGLQITYQDDETSFEVHLDPAYGVEAQFRCRVIEVVSLVPGIPSGSVYARAKA